MKRTLYLLGLAATVWLRSCETAPASETVNATISATNLPAAGNAVAVTGVQTMWTNGTPAGLSFVQTTNTTAWAATNLYLRLAVRNFTNVNSVAMVNETNVVLYGMADTPLVVTVSGNWGAVTYTTNVTSDDGKALVYPMFKAVSTNEWTNQANAVIEMVGFSNATTVIAASAPAFGNMVTLATNELTRTNLNLRSGIAFVNMSAGLVGGIRISNAYLGKVTVDQDIIWSQTTRPSIDNGEGDKWNFNENGFKDTNTTARLGDVMRASNTVITSVTTSNLSYTGANTFAGSNAFTGSNYFAGIVRLDAGALLDDALFSVDGSRSVGIEPDGFEGPGSVVVLGDFDTTQFSAEAYGAVAMRSGAVVTNVTARGVTAVDGMLNLSSATVSSLVAGNNIMAKPTNNVVLLSATAGAATLCGISGGLAGDWLWVVNGTTYPLTVASESGFSTTATNRITVPGGASNVTVVASGYAQLYYNGSRWLCVYPETFPNVNAIVNSSGYGTNTTLVTPVLIGTNGAVLGYVWTATDTNGNGKWQATVVNPTNDATFTGTTTFTGPIQTTNGVSNPKVAVFNTYGWLVAGDVTDTDVAAESLVSARFADVQAATNAHYSAIQTNLTNIAARLPFFGGTATNLSARYPTGSTNSPFVVRNTNGAAFVEWSTNGTMLWPSDNTYDIGTSSSGRPRNMWVGNNFRAFVVNSDYLYNEAGTTSLRLNAGGSIQLASGGGNSGFNLLQFGGTTAAYPALARTNGHLMVVGGDGNMVNPTNGLIVLTLQVRASAATNTPPAGHAAFFSATNSGVVEMMVTDSAGNTTQLSSHPLDAPPVFYIVTNWVSGAPDIKRTVKPFAGVIEWENSTLTHLVNRWMMDRDLGTTNAFTNLTTLAKVAIRAAMHREESFATYNARMGYTNGDARALVKLNWAAVQAQRQADWDRCRSNELAQVAAGATNVFPRPAMDVTEPKPALVDWQAP